MLGTLHKVSLGTAPPGIAALFPKGPVTFPLPYPLRVGFHLNRPSHKRQILTPCTRLSTEKFKRSVYGIIAFYNALPQWVVEIPSTQVFQGVLQKAVLRFSAKSDRWPKLLKSEWMNIQCATLDELFRKEDLSVSGDPEPTFPCVYESNSDSE
jgi:hypothetical protein